MEKQAPKTEDALQRPVKASTRRKGPKHPVIRIIKGAFITFSTAKGAEASASLAYYTIFSIFPLLLVIVGVGSALVNQTVVEQQIAEFLTRFFPVSQDFILTNIQQIFASRGALSALSLIGLIWSSTGVFSTLIRNINSAWPAAAPHSYFSLKLASIGIVFALTLVMIISSFSFTVKNLLISMGIPLDTETIGAFLSSALYTQVIPALIRLGVLFLLYFRVPQIHVKKKAALYGAILATISWQILTVGFSAYMREGMPRYEIIYGSLGKIIALLAFTYFIGWITLFGAHLTSSIDRHTD
jgi:membrane protein